MPTLQSLAPVRHGVLGHRWSRAALAAAGVALSIFPSTSAFANPEDSSIVQFDQDDDFMGTHFTSVDDGRITFCDAKARYIYVGNWGYDNEPFALGKTLAADALVMTFAEPTRSLQVSFGHDYPEAEYPGLSEGDEAVLRLYLADELVGTARVVADLDGHITQTIGAGKATFNRATLAFEGSPGAVATNIVIDNVVVGPSVDAPNPFVKCNAEDPDEEPDIEPQPMPVAPTRACTVKGTGEADKLVGTPGDDVLCGFGGDDVIRGRGGDDIIRGGRGADELRGNAGDDVVRGNADRDRLWGGRGTDVAFGGSHLDFSTGFERFRSVKLFD